MNVYEMSYPITTDWNKLVWIVEKGDIIDYCGKRYTIIQILKSSSYKIEPRLILKPIY
jgi:hypothetical protein